MKLKTIYETFAEEDFRLLKKAKGDLTWHDFILSMAKKRNKKGKKKNGDNPTN